jgi:alpha-amylase
MQMACYKILKELESLVKQTEDPELIRLWRYLQISDHLYYMSTKGGGPGDVHNYFNPHGNPVEAFVTYLGVLSNFEATVLRQLEKPMHIAKRILRKLPADKGFKFFYKVGKPTRWKAQSLKEFYLTLKKVDLTSVKFHAERGDFGEWIRWTIGDDELADRLAEATRGKRVDENLRKRILGLVEQRIKELEATIRASPDKREPLTHHRKPNT